MFKKRMVCLQVALFDWLVLGCPQHAPRELMLGRKLKCSQWSVSTLSHLSWDANSPNEVTACMMGRAASKFETFEDEVAALHECAERMQPEKGFSYFLLVRPRSELHGF